MIHLTPWLRLRVPQRGQRRYQSGVTQWALLHSVIEPPLDCGIHRRFRSTNVGCSWGLEGGFGCLGSGWLRRCRSRV